MTVAERPTSPLHDPRPWGLLPPVEREKWDEIDCTGKYPPVAGSEWWTKHKAGPTRAHPIPLPHVHTHASFAVKKQMTAELSAPGEKEILFSVSS